MFLVEIEVGLLLHCSTDLSPLPPQGRHAMIEEFSHFCLSVRYTVIGLLTKRGMENQSSSMTGLVKKQNCKCRRRVDMQKQGRSKFDQGDPQSGNE